jgi:hypothetical protein
VSRSCPSTGVHDLSQKPRQWRQPVIPTLTWRALTADDAAALARVLAEGCSYMDPISIKDTGAPFPSRGADRVCFVIAVQRAATQTLGFVHNPS